MQPSNRMTYELVTIFSSIIKLTIWKKKNTESYTRIDIHIVEKVPIGSLIFELFRTLRDSNTANSHDHKTCGLILFF